MASATGGSRPDAPGAARTSRGTRAAIGSFPARKPWARAMRLARRRLLPSDGVLLVALTLVSAVLVLLFNDFPRYASPSAFTLVLIVGGFWLRVPSFVVLQAVVAASLVIEDALASGHLPPGAIVVLVLTAVLTMMFARIRAEAGVQGMRGQSMLVDLRDRLRAQAVIPPLPEGWHAELALRSAYGASFSGDFVVARRGDEVLELVVVDVSGKGIDAGTRALMLSGAFGGLLGSLAPDGFLPAANTYLLRQRWSEGFATAAHLVIDLETGSYALTLAGHPSPAQFHAGSGRWRPVGAGEGPLLGVLPRARYTGETGVLRPGDALLLYTDGLVETPGEDLSVGIDRLLGHAEKLVRAGFTGGAKQLLEAVGAVDDDRTLLLLWRR